MFGLLKWTESKYLDEKLRNVFRMIRKKCFSEFEPDSLRVMLASLDWHLTEKDGNFSVPKDNIFQLQEVRQWKEKQGSFVNKGFDKQMALHEFPR